jgi:(p)ppGpp synthase/HD superfamily hydrolase
VHEVYDRSKARPVGAADGEQSYARTMSDVVSNVGDASLSDLEIRARDFATAAHARVGQVRKYTGLPYITHPAAVVEIVRGVPHSDAMLAAGWLHDVVEDTGTPAADVLAAFGAEVADLVGWLTDVSKPGDGNRAVRKAIDRAHSAQAPAAAKTVKLADLIDNARSILQYDRGFARVYLAEKRALLEVLGEGDAALWARADEIVRVGQRVLDETP